MLVSVVINTYNRAPTLEVTLEALRGQSFLDFEIVVVNGPSTDGTDALLAARSGELRSVRCPERHLARSRNLGIDAAAGDVVAFIDDDAVPEPMWLDELVAAYGDPAVAGAGGVVLDESGVRPQYRFSACDRVGRPDFDVVPPLDALVQPGADPFLYLQGTNMSFRREALEQVGGFDEEIEYNYEEADACLRLMDAGHFLTALDGARVHHKVAASHLRRAPGVALDPFHEIKNRVYFAVRHGRASRTLLEVVRTLEPHIEHVRATAREQHAAGSLSAAELERLLARLDEGFEVGVSRGLAGARRDRAIAPRDPSAFRPYNVLRPGGRRLRTCFVSLDYPPPRGGGIARFTRDLAAAMAAEGHEVHVVAQGEREDRVDLEDGVWVHRHPGGERFIPELDGHPLAVPVKRIATAYRAVARLHGLAPLDVLSAPMWAGEPLLCAHDPRWTTVVTCMTPMRVVAATQPAVAARAESALQVRLEDATAAAAGRLHAISHAILDDLREHVPAARAVPADVLPLGAPDRRSAFPRRRVAGDDAVEVLFAGRLEPRKGVDVLLDAAIPLLRERPDTRLKLIGADSGFAVEDGTRYADRLARDAPDIGDRVMFTGEVADDVLFQAYADCDVFCAPSRYDSFGLVLIEAMSFGRPVVAGHTGGMVEIVADGETGLLVEPGDANALREALRLLIDDALLRRRLGAAGRARFETEFAAPLTARRTAAAYAAAAGAGKGLPPSAASAEAQVRAAAATLLQEVGGVEADSAARAAARLLAPAAFPADHEAGLRRASALADDAEFISGVYRTLLGRSPESEGLRSALDLLAETGSRLEVIRAVAGSDEARARGVDRGVAERLRGIDPIATIASLRAIWTLDDEEFLQRLPDALGVVGPGEPLRADARAALPRGRRAALEAVLGRDEVASVQIPPVRAALRSADLRTRAELESELRRLAQLSPGGFVDGVYQLLLGRAADTGGLDAHRTRLEGGARPVEVVRAIATSAEAAARGIEPSWLEGIERNVPALTRTRRPLTTLRRALRQPGRAGAMEERLDGQRRALERLGDRLVRAVRAIDVGLAARLDELEASLVRVRDDQAAAHEHLRADLREAIVGPRVFGPGDRLSIASTALVHDALFNTVSGSVTVGEHAFFGHGVAVLTGTHEIDRLGADRQKAIPDAGRDVEIGEGAWIASRATVLGPCRIGAHAVVAAGAVVTGDVPAGAVVAGNPARIVREVASAG